VIQIRHIFVLKFRNTITMKKLLFLAILGIFGLSSCKKEPAPITIKKPIDFLTEKNWKYLEFNNQLKACDADDVLSFSTGGDFIIELGSNHCTSNEGEQITGTWAFINEESQIIKEYTVFGSLLTDTLSIIRLNEKEFKYVDENNNSVVLEHL